MGDPTVQLAAPLSNLSLSSPSTSSPSHGGEPTSTTSAAALKPSFFPPLWLARRTAALQILRKENIRSVVDLGCGEGALLQVLSNPANHLDDFPSLYPPSPYSITPSTSPVQTLLSSRPRKLDILRSVPRPPAIDNELHLRRLVGVDIRQDALENAIRVTSLKDPPPAGSAKARWSLERERWEPLQAEVWLGACETYNDQLDGVEAMTACEVIEHLTPAALAKFPSTILGTYSPRIVLVTTPNHEFNPWFMGSSSSEEAAHRFPDPTGRTQRVFRDDDHQFEWTQAEFQSWAKAVAAEHDYIVTFTGVGSLSSYYGSQSIPACPPSLFAHPELANAPRPTDPSTFFATQIAIFRLQFSHEAERSPRSHRIAPLPFFSPTTTPDLGQSARPNPLDRPNAQAPALVHRHSTSNVPHVLLKTSLHPAHPAAGNPASCHVVLETLARVFREEFGKPKVVLRDLWSQESIRIVSGGMIGAVVDAVLEEERDEWDFVVDATGGKVGDLAIEIWWKGWVDEEVDDAEEDRSERVGSGEEESGDEDDRVQGAAFVAGEEEDDDNSWEDAIAQELGARIER